MNAPSEMQPKRCIIAVLCISYCAFIRNSGSLFASRFSCSASRCRGPEAPAPPPSLRNPGEKLPTDSQTTGVMRPVQFPKPHRDDMPGANPDEQPSTSPSGSQNSQPAASQTPSSGSDQQQSAPSSATPATGSPKPPASTSQLVSSGSGAAQRD